MTDKANEIQSIKLIDQIVETKVDDLGNLLVRYRVKTKGGKEQVSGWIIM